MDGALSGARAAGQSKEHSRQASGLCCPWGPTGRGDWTPGCRRCTGLAGRATGAGTHRPSTSQWPALPAAETSAGGGCWLSPQTTQFITPFIPHLFTNALATFLSHQQKGGGRIQPHMADLALEHFPWPILGGDYMDRTIYFHEGSGLMVHSSQEGGVDRVGGGRGGRRGSQQPPRWHSLHSNRPHPTHTTLARPVLPPTNFSGQREARARDWRIKFDLKEFYRSAQ